MARRRLRAQTDDEVPGVTRLQPLATGGNSTVYKAWQPDLDRWVAVKVLGVTLSDRRARERFLRECKAVGRLTGHPNIVTVLESGITRSNRPFLTMDLFGRGSLADLIAASGPVWVEQTLRWGVKLAGALETAHRAGILHRDVKPENVLLSHFGEPGLADFGIATLGEAQGDTKAFTASHAAPEVLEDRTPTAAADIYGLGSTLWTALAGRLPFGDEAQGILKLMQRVLQEPLPPLGRDDVPPSVEAALRWAMAKDPAERPPSAAEFGNHLRSIQPELGLPVSDLVVPDGLDRLIAPGRADIDEAAQDRRPPSPPPRRPGPVTITSDGVAPVPADRGSSPSEPPNEGSGGLAADADSDGRSAGGKVDVPSPWAPVGPDDASTAAGALGTPGPTTERHAADRHRPPAVESRPGEAASPPTRNRTVAVLAGALVFGAGALVAIALLLAPDDGSGPPSATRSPTDVAVRVLDEGVVMVTWTPPADRSGLTGYVVVHRPNGSGTDTQQVVGAAAVEAVVALSTPGSHCFVVAAVYGPMEPAAGSERACT